MLQGVGLRAALTMVGSLVRDARGPRAKWWIARYFLARAGLGVARPPDAVLQWASSSGTLSVGVLAGGLASWHEIAHLRAYAPIDSFVPRPGWTVIDVGANIGAYVAWSAGHMAGSGRIVAVEPNPVSLKHLHQTASTLDLEIEIIAAAAGSETTQGTLRYQPGYTVASSLVSSDPDALSVSVEVCPLDDIVALLELHDIDLLKVDVEGSEADVLAGASRILRHTRRVVLETESGQIEERCRLLLEAAGFTLKHERPGGVWRESGLLLQAYESSPATPRPI